MRVAVVEYPGIRRECYEQLIGAALELAKQPRMQTLARWEWPRFSQWLVAHPFQMDTGCADRSVCATKCDPPQRMRRFPATMNCWERALHTLAWFAARGAARATLYDHDTLVGRHIEVLVPPTTYLGAAKSLPARGPANGAAEQAVAGVLGGLQGGLTGAGAGMAAGPYGALAGFILGAGIGAAKGALDAGKPAPVVQPAPAAPPPPVPTVPALPSSARAPPEVTTKAAPLPDQLVRVLGKPQPKQTTNKRVKARKTPSKKRKKKE